MTQQAGLLSPTMIALAGRCVPRTAARPAPTLATSVRSRTIVVIFHYLRRAVVPANSAMPIAHALRLGVFRDAPIGSNAGLPTEVENAAGPGHFYGLGILNAAKSNNPRNLSGIGLEFAALAPVFVGSSLRAAFL
jgi:hypothetical protein